MNIERVKGKERQVYGGDPTTLGMEFWDTTIVVVVVVVVFDDENGNRWGNMA